MLIDVLPRAALTRFAGRVARHPASRRLIPWFARHYGIDVDAALVPADGFYSLQAFFCRQLKPGLRPLDPDPDVWLSPVDATVGASGTIHQDEILQAKGRPYSLAALLGDPNLAAGYAGGLFCTLYLAPADYHRIHAPAAATVPAARSIPGDFYPVNPGAVARVQSLFAGNERMIVPLETPHGPMLLVLVGACLVGGIRLVQNPPFTLQRGQELGRFEFGSTVIVLLPPEADGLLIPRPGDRIAMGQALIRRVGAQTEAEPGEKNRAAPPPEAC